MFKFIALLAAFAAAAFTAAAFTAAAAFTFAKCA
jgi:hypothetical protein